MAVVNARGIDSREPDFTAAPLCEMALRHRPSPCNERADPIGPDWLSHTLVAWLTIVATFRHVG